MVMQENVLLVSAVCTLEGMQKCVIDWNTAFLQTDEESGEQYAEIPYVPPDLQGEYGYGEHRTASRCSRKKFMDVTMREEHLVVKSLCTSSS